MGCYHFHLNQLSRGKGQSAIASAAYRAGAKLECTYYGEVSDYTRKGGVVLAEKFIFPNRLRRDSKTGRPFGMRWNGLKETRKHSWHTALILP